MATDGVYVYATLDGTSGLRCPVADQGANCTDITAGWPSGTTNALAAGGGDLWLGQNDGKIYRCDVDGTFACGQLDDAGNRPVLSLLLANGRLYAGLGVNSGGIFIKKYGLVWSCDAYATDSCGDLDNPGDSSVQALAAGGGYLWAGLSNGIIWRCDLNLKDRCADWYTAHGLAQLSYDGQGTLYAGTLTYQQGDESAEGSILTCSTTTTGACSVSRKDYGGVTGLAAGAGSFFASSYSSAPFYFGATPFTTGQTIWNNSSLLYFPAAGLAATGGVGGATVHTRFPAAAGKLAARCERGKKVKAKVRATGPHGYQGKGKVDLCRLWDAGTSKLRFGLLDPGRYTVTVRVKRYVASATFDVDRESTTVVNLELQARKPRSQPETGGDRRGAATVAEEPGPGAGPARSTGAQGRGSEAPEDRRRSPAARRD